ncbi:hypothetical protein EU545_01805 [Candidatus Thorarchaeota archaeon]|nr:MAG: hypothetical protein EU545_01805 [Candidatus Thorarchaeota archaeon]
MDIKKINEQLEHLSWVFSDILAERGLLESKLFPVNEYISVGFYQTYERQFEVMKQVWDRISPEELARKSKTLLSEIQALSITYQWLYYSLARMGVIFNKCEGDPSKESVERQEQWKWLLEKWYDLATNYFNSGKPTVASSGATNLAFEEETLGWLHDQLEPVTEVQVKKMRRAIGSVDLYAFMDECEARAKIIDHGPYPVGANEILVASEYTHLHDGKEDLWLPWSDTEAKLPTSTLGVAMTIRDATATFNDIGTMTVEPGDYSRLVTQACAYCKRGQKVVPLGLDELSAYAEAADSAQAELYMKFAEWDKKTLMIAGAEAYWKCFARYTDQVGITDRIDWKLSPEIIDEHVPFFMENDADPAFIRFGRFDEEMEEDPTLYLLPE